ncbi:MAG: type II secretion system GspH family protein [Phycisphaerales bacterium]|jgi:prepilin-type N-terminal cleavage/methylation domain-containing protein|nr:type II secretion system GspH family protein [Phycisphaerales bacterium]
MRRAFTLIELLVVTAVIALLIGILLPSLAKAREASRAAVCQINFKSIGQGLAMYANDNKDRIWETGTNAPFRFWYAQPRNPRLAVSASNPAVLGPAFEYLSIVDRVFECPTNKRRARTTFTSNPNDPYWNTPQGILQRGLWEQFLGERSLNFDYTMGTGTSGAKIGTYLEAAWDSGCRTRSGTAARATVLNAAPSTFVRLSGVPIYFEEDTRWWNAESPDGMFSNWDQMSKRHDGKGHMVTLGGDVIALDAPVGPQADTQADLGDLVGNDFYVSSRGNRWFQLAPSWPATNRPYGWIDQPR